jgi:hypothetical protein
MRDALLRDIAALQLPANFLDHLMDELGGPGQVGGQTDRQDCLVGWRSMSNNQDPLLARMLVGRLVQSPFHNKRRLHEDTV